MLRFIFGLSTLFHLPLSGQELGQQETSKPADTLIVRIKATDSTGYMNNYPEGIYANKTIFLRKQPDDQVAVKPVPVIKRKDRKEGEVDHLTYFFDEKTNKKLKNVFAISHKGYLYFQIKAILNAKNRNKTDRAQGSHHPNAFVRVIMGGKNYLYTETVLANKWAQGTAYNFGAAGGAAAAGMSKGKGVVWDMANQEFNIFKSCKDFNKFMQSRLPEALQECQGHQPDMAKVREAMETIK